MPIPLPVIADTYRCALRWVDASSGQTAVNVIHIKANGSGSTASDAYAALNSSVVAAMWDSATNGTSIFEVDITPLDGVTGTQSFSTGSPSKWSGSAGGDFIPSGACLIKLTTGLRGRNNRGRVFIPFLAEAIQANGLLSSTGQSAIDAGWTTFVSNLVGLSPTQWDLGVAAYDRKNSGAGAHFTGVTAVTCERPTAVQRKRQERLR